MFKVTSLYQPPISEFIRTIATLDPRLSFLLSHASFDESSSCYGLFSAAYLGQVLLCYCMTSNLRTSNMMFSPNNVMRDYLEEGISKEFDRYHAKYPTRAISQPGQLNYCSILALISFYRVRPVRRRETGDMSRLQVEYNQVCRLRESLWSAAHRVLSPIRQPEEPSDDEAEKCSICIRTMTKHPVKELKSCGHSFHRRCIAEWLRTSETCPLCRKAT